MYEITYQDKTLNCRVNTLEEVREALNLAAKEGDIVYSIHFEGPCGTPIEMYVNGQTWEVSAVTTNGEVL